MVNRSSFVIAIALYPSMTVWLDFGALDVLISGWRTITDRYQAHEFQILGVELLHPECAAFVPSFSIAGTAIV